MSDDFLADLGETLRKHTKDIGSRADSFFESQKLRSKIVSEQRMIDKVMGDIGNIIYREYVEGEAVDESVKELCEDITQRKNMIAAYRDEIAKMKGQKVCAACGTSVPEDAAFCMQCGAPCDLEEEEDESVSTFPKETDVTDRIRQEAEEAEAEKFVSDMDIIDE